VVAVVREIVWVQPKDMRANTWNPNVESPEKFNLLVESVQDIGFSENVQVRPIGEGEFREVDGQKRWYGKKQPSLEIIGGEHRWQACMVAGMENDWIPAVFFTDLDEDKLKAVTVRMNIIGGEMDPEKFTALWDGLYSTGHFSEQALRDMMGIASRGEFEKLYKKVKASLPSDMQAALDKMKGEIKTIDDLSLILNKLFRQHGSELQYSYMTFEFGGRQHTWVRLKRETNGLLNKVKIMCREKNVDMNDVLKLGFETAIAHSGWKPSAEVDQSLEEW
jgi:hypothetical protein